jgi:hypothetical protein
MPTLVLTFLQICAILDRVKQENPGSKASESDRKRWAKEYGSAAMSNELSKIKSNGDPVYWKYRLTTIRLLHAAYGKPDPDHESEEKRKMEREEGGCTVTTKSLREGYSKLTPCKQDPTLSKFPPKRQHPSNATPHLSPQKIKIKIKIKNLDPNQMYPAVALQMQLLL